MYIVILLVVLSSLTVMFLCFKYEKDKTNEKRTIKMAYIYISSILMGAIGAIFSMIGFNFETKNKKFVIIEVLLSIVQITLIIMYYLKIK